MKQHLGATAVLALILAATPVPAAEGPPADAPPDFVEVWLRFHEQQLCESIDAVFVFRPALLEVWMVVDEEKNYEKLHDLLTALRAAGRAQIYPTRMPPETRSTSERMPPPGLWTNNELRSYLLVPFNENRRLAGLQPDEDGFHNGDRFYRQRLTAYADQTLEWNRHLRREAQDLRALGTFAYGTSATAGLRARAAAVCQAHIRELDRNAERLIGNLTLAVPRPDRRAQGKSAQEPRLPPPVSPSADVSRLASTAGTASQRVQRFIYPRAHTVTLENLRESDLLSSLRSLRTLATDVLARLAGAAAPMK